MKKKHTLTFAGDTSLGEWYLQRLKRNSLSRRLTHDPFSFFQKIAPLIKDSDHFILNLETVLEEEPAGLFPDKLFLNWDNPERTLNILKSIGVTAVGLANNHSMDFGPDVLLATIDNLREAGIQVFGAGRNIREANSPLNFKLTSGNCSKNVYVITAMNAGKRYKEKYRFFANTESPGISELNPDVFLDDITTIHKSDPEALIIAFPHWQGQDYKWASQYSWVFQTCRRCIEAGANFVFGHGPHMANEIERYQDGIIAYSLGNFVFNSPGRYKKFNVPPISLIARLEVTENNNSWLINSTFHPIMTDNRRTDYRVRAVARNTAQKIVQVLTEKYLPNTNNILIELIDNEINDSTETGRSLAEHEFAHVGDDKTIIRENKADAANDVLDIMFGRKTFADIDFSVPDIIQKQINYLGESHSKIDRIFREYYDRLSRSRVLRKNLFNMLQELADIAKKEYITHGLLRKFEREKMQLPRALSFREIMIEKSAIHRLGCTDFAWKIDEKNDAYKFADAIGLRRPFTDGKIYRFEEIPEPRTPLVIKPVHSTGSMGVYLIFNEKTILSAREGIYLNSWAAVQNDARKKIADGKSGKNPLLRTNRWIIEELILSDKDSTAPPNDLKFYSFYGEVVLILEANRAQNDKFCFWDSNMKLAKTGKYEAEGQFFGGGKGFSKQDLDTVISVSRSIPAPFMRIDMLKGYEGLVFGEATPRPGKFHLFNDYYDRRLGEAYRMAEARLFDDLVNGTGRFPDLFFRQRSTKKSKGPKNTGNEVVKNTIIGNGPNSYKDFPSKRGTLKIPIYLISKAAKKRGMECVLHEDKIFQLNGHGKSVLFYNNAPENSITATAIAANKSLTKAVLKLHGLPIPEGEQFNDYKAAEQYFVAKFTPQVVKPNFGTHGSRISTNVSSVAELKRAWHTAFKSNAHVIIEDFVNGDDLRILIIGGEARAAYLRLPAHVIGNGRDSVQTLIDRKNSARMHHPALRYTPIKRHDLLDAQGLDLTYVPNAGEKVQLTGVSNISAGGESIELFDSVHPSILVIAEQAVSVISGLKVAGVDIIVPDFTQNVSPTNKAIILEINADPAITEHVYPTFGTSTDLPGIMIDFILEDENIGRNKQHNAVQTSSGHAAPYTPTCGGTAFSRKYSLHRDLLEQAAYRNNQIVTRISNSLVVLSDNGHRVMFFDRMSDRILAVSRMIARNKTWTRNHLSSSEIQIPRGDTFDPEQQEAAWQYAEKLGKPVVVKPQSKSKGRGLSGNIATKAHFQLAWKLACATSDKAVLVEEHFPAHTFRLFVAGCQVLAAAQLMPVHVVGDGLHSIAQLADLKNAERASNPYLRTKPLEFSEMTIFWLALQNLSSSSILPNGHHVQINPLAVIGAGGDSINVSDIVHPGFVDIAVRAKDALFDPFHAGVDILAEDISLAPEHQKWVVTGVDVNPDLAMYHFPAAGTPRDAAGALLTLLFPESLPNQAIPKKSVNVLIKGKVQGVGMRKWIWRNAHLHALSGWVQNNPDGTVEALFSGPVNAVEHMVDLCRKGLKRAVVKELTTTAAPANPLTGFVVNDNSGENM